MSKSQEYMIAVFVTDIEGNIRPTDVNKIVQRGVLSGVASITTKLTVGEVKIIYADKSTGWIPKFKKTGRKSYPAWIDTLR